MGRNEQRDKIRLPLRHTLFVLVIILALLQPLSVAEAGWLDRMKEIYQLPEHVEDIQQRYDETKQQLDEQVGKLEEQKEQLTAQQDKLAESIRQSQLREEQLIAQNRVLQEQNETLQERLLVMEQAEEAKDARMRKLTTMGITAISLVIGYFLLGRLFRVVVWRRQKGKLRYK
jgi:predicted nuclease with TOPRIM domain